MPFRFRPKIPLFISKEFSSVLRLGFGFLHPLIFSRGNSPSFNFDFVLFYQISFFIHLQRILPVLRIGFGFLHSQVIFSRGKFPISLLLSPPFCLSTLASEIAPLWSASHSFFQTIFQIRNVVFDRLPHVKMPFCLPLEWGGHLLGSDLLTSPPEGGDDDDNDEDNAMMTTTTRTTNMMMKMIMVYQGLSLEARVGEGKPRKRSNSLPVPKIEVWAFRPKDWGMDIQSQRLRYEHSVPKIEVWTSSPKD